MTEVWQAGKTYVPGALARPTSGPAQVQTVPDNPNFEDDLTGWTVVGAGGWSAVTDKVYDGAKSAKYIGNGLSLLVNNIRAPVVAGQAITVFCVVSLDQQASDVAAARIVSLWYDVGGNLIDTGDKGPPVIYKAKSGAWQQSIHTATAPANAAFASFGISANADAASFVRVDGCGWKYVYGGPPAGLVYKAVQAAPGKSGTAEPAWPQTLGVTVVDNQVTWEAVLASQIVYTARPINRSGATEPAWPTSVGGFVHDGTIDWEAITPQVTDVNCPRTKIVVIAASKIYAADDDIIRYCATVNPLDWTTANDAGYLPSGLQTYGSNPVKAMNLYRSNLAAFNAEGMQLWQVDEDPAQTALLDALPVGSTQNQALSPVANDLIFLSSQGVRSIGVTSSSTNLQAGDIGMPIDPLVKAAVAESPAAPISTYVPALGQYWLAIADPTTPGPTIAGTLGNGIVGDLVDFHYAITATGSYTAEIISGQLPSGLTMDATGHVTGTRIGVDNETFVVRVTDADSRTVSKTDTSRTSVGSYKDAVIADEPEFFWPLNDASDVAVELMQSFNGSYIGTTYSRKNASLLPNGEGGCAYFDSIDAAVQTPASELLANLNYPFTIEGWVKVTQPVAAVQEYFLFRGSQLSVDVDVDFFGRGHLRRWTSSSGFDLTTQDHTVDPGIPYYIVATATQNEMNFYVNGTLVKTTDYGLGDAERGAEAFLIGALVTNSSTGDRRALQNIAVYTHVLTAGQVENHWQAAQP